MASSLTKAFESAANRRATVADGSDPLAKPQETRPVPRFAEAAHMLIADKEPWRSTAYKADWETTLGVKYCGALQSKLINQICTEDVLAVLRPIWQAEPRTALRVRGRIEAVFTWALLHGYLRGENPAVWRGRLDALLPKHEVRASEHFSALPYNEVGAFIRRLRERKATAALALEFAILTVARSSYVLGATWAEFDRERMVWTIPAQRRKVERNHRIPLSNRALEILDTVREKTREDFVFRGDQPGRSLSANAMRQLIRRMRVDVTIDGFRSTFRDWAQNEMFIAKEVLDAALAHVADDQAETVDGGTGVFDRQRRLMIAWAIHCDPLKRGHGAIRTAAGASE